MMACARGCVLGVSPLKSLSGKTFPGSCDDFGAVRRLWWMMELVDEHHSFVVKRKAFAVGDCLSLVRATHWMFNCKPF